MPALQIYQVVAPRPIVIDDGGLVISYAPNQVFSASPRLPSIIRQLEAGNIVPTSRFPSAAPTTTLITDEELFERYIKADGTRSFTGSQSLGGHFLTDLHDPADPQDAATKAYVDASSPTGVIKADGSVAFTANESMGGFKITNLGTPTASSDAATKAYVDAASPGVAFVDHTGSATLSTSDTGKHHTNIGAGASISLTLPTWSRGLRYVIELVDNFGIAIVAPGTDVIRLSTLVSSAGGNFSASSVGSTVDLVAIKSGIWLATSITGSWTPA